LMAILLVMSSLTLFIEYLLVRMKLKNLLITLKAQLLSTVKSLTFILITNLGSGYHILVNSSTQLLLWVLLLSMEKILHLSELKMYLVKDSSLESKIGYVINKIIQK
jgi:hypothetical protein